MNDSIDDKQPCSFCDYGGIGSTVKTYLGHSQLAVDQSIIQYNVGKGFRKCTPDEETGLICTNKQCIAHYVEIKKGKSPYPDKEKINYLRGDLLIVNGSAK